MRSVDELLAELQDVAGGAGGLLASADPKILESLDQLREITRNLEVTTRRLKADPSILIWGTGEEVPSPSSIPMPASQDLPWMGPIEEP